MATKHVINAETRDVFGRNAMNRLRSEGRIPGVVYGPDQKPIHVSVDNRELSNLLQHVTFENTIIDLKITGKVKKNFQTLIRDLQQHPYRSQIRHLDFYCVPKGRTVSVEVPIVLEGTPAGVRSQGGLVQHTLRDLHIEVLPDNIPEQIVIDVSELLIGHSIHVSDLPKGDYQVLTDAERPIVTIIPPTVVKVAAEEGEEAEAVGEEAPEPELIGREKEAEEE